MLDIMIFILEMKKLRLREVNLPNTVEYEPTGVISRVHDQSPCAAGLCSEWQCSRHAQAVSLMSCLEKPSRPRDSFLS